MMLRVGVVRPDRLDPWPDRSGQAPGLSGRPDRPAGLRQPCMYIIIELYHNDVTATGRFYIMSFFRLLRCISYTIAIQCLCFALYIYQ